VAGSLLSAMPRATLSYHIDDLDAHMTREVWDTLPERALVIGSHEWRTVPVTGRLTRSFVDNTTVLDSWLHYVKQGSDASDLAGAGFDFVYVDEAWWEKMEPEQKASYSRECVSLVAEVQDTSKTHFRRLYNVSSCAE
jgi:hypothetical protein